jgi:hypothetical protein
LFHKPPSEIISDLGPQRIFGATARLKKKKSRFSVGTCTILKTTTMGVDGLLRELHGGRMTEQQRV